ncbi:MAG: hypothetical protein ABIH49_00815 [archaeon]
MELESLNELNERIDIQFPKEITDGTAIDLLKYLNQRMEGVKYFQLSSHSVTYTSFSGSQAESRTIRRSLTMLTRPWGPIYFEFYGDNPGVFPELFNGIKKVSSPGNPKVKEICNLMRSHIENYFTQQEQERQLQEQNLPPYLFE